MAPPSLGGDANFISKILFPGVVTSRVSTPDNAMCNRRPPVIGSSSKSLIYILPMRSTANICTNHSRGSSSVPLVSVFLAARTAKNTDTTRMPVTNPNPTSITATCPTPALAFADLKSRIFSVEDLPRPAFAYAAE